MDNKTIDARIADLKRIKKQNALYKKLSPAQRRVEVAKDALLHVQKGFWKPKSETGYVSLAKSLEIDKSACSWYPGQTECTVCARGALFLGALNKFNNWNPKDCIDTDCYGRLKHIDDCEFGDVEDRLWSSKQIAEIELIFELSNIGAAEYYNWAENTDLIINQWEKQYPKDKDRLIAILKNIIRNKGTFLMADKHDVKFGKPGKIVKKK